jgi:hypothetical protein
MLVDKSFKDGGELLLLTARQLRGGFEKLFHLAGWAGAGHASWFR